MDQLTAAERAEVETHLTTFPELRLDLREIENALSFFAKAASLTAPAGLKNKIMDALKDEFITDTRSGNGTWRLFTFLFAFGLVVLGYLFIQRNNQLKSTEQELTDLRDTCVTTQQRLNDRLNILQQLTAPQNQIIPFTATPAFTSNTDIYLHHNPITKRNFIQVRNLPPLPAGQTFELWSIKTGQAPARMDLFTTPAEGLVEVQYVEGTDVYAITIEQAGGVDSPTMANLIGTVAVNGQ
jgi:anti-sigma-K factor RskA